MGLIEALATLGQYLPAVTKPKEKPSLTAKLLFSGLGVIIYLLMASVPLYGITSSSFNNFLLEQVVFASTAGTLAQLGIGPIITAGLIMQILVGSKLIDMDLNDTDDRSKFTTSQKGLAFVFILLESFLFGYVLTIHSGDLNLMFIVAGQLILSTFVILLLDEMIQKGWGLGSGVSLFILAGVAKIMFWDMFGIAAVQSQNLPVGFFPSLVSSLASGAGLANLIVDVTKPFQPDLVGFLSTIVLIILLVYLTAININIPVTSQRLRGIRRTIPLNFLYVSSIPVIFVSVLASDIGLFASMASYVSSSASSFLTQVENLFIFPPPTDTTIPHSVYAVVVDPVGAAIYVVIFVVLSLLFGVLWVNVAGLDARTQAENLIESGVEIPGIRSNPRALEGLLAKYIKPLTFYSSLIVGVIGSVATLLGVYGTGVGLLLAVTIAIQYYSLLAYERSIEMYPLLKRIIGEE
ncbi:preprotein translocase subunit SecY [Sulfodiicoccus acidiphilus]|uniref:Protein translocase subunit SecY n=1 Tax=Sulfodiicoccus acidiphilus TaxID=1670455 RepID=A0A348B165_9CREN|nr:preprotein translocase subunit SecY [Sulfodiicoccus acidiphilus]BBD71917.1 preprotein translocase subunit SecY [Sulfodiicoccus acidiphilus]GGT91444.1 preprotein translocase subunit SecY [Sulfodiicoccus acidiphilus]